jgi:AP-1 complex subunit sigma 1/2
MFLLINRQGKTRLVKFYENTLLTERKRIIKEISRAVVGRSGKLSNFYEWQNYKVIYKRYASLYFIMLCDLADNELIALEVIHQFVECLDDYFINVCELDIIFNFHKTIYIIEELITNGYIQEVDRTLIKSYLTNQDDMLKEEKEEEYNFDPITGNKAK